jgi:hypothetical protein
MLSNSMGRLHSWEADSSSSDQEISHTLWVTKVYYFVHKTAALVPILSQINLFHASPLYFLKVHFNIILPSTPRPAEWPLCFRFPHRNPVCTSPLPIRATCLVHATVLDLNTLHSLRSQSEERSLIRRQILSILRTENALMGILGAS